MTLRALGIMTLAAAAFALSACDKQEDTPATKAVQGKILDRSIGDDMLPYDTVRSQPPLLGPQTTDGEAPPQPGGGPTLASAQESPAQDDEAGNVENEEPEGGLDAAPAEPTPAAE